MNNDERDALRSRVEAEPNDERGKLARVLMLEVDRLHNEKQQEVRAQLIWSLTRNHHLTSEEALRYVDTKPLPTFQMERGPCRACRGSGATYEMGCIGGRHKKCDTCKGRGTHTRLRLPWAPLGEVVDLGFDRTTTSE